MNESQYLIFKKCPVWNQAVSLLPNVTCFLHVLEPKRQRMPSKSTCPMFTKICLIFTFLFHTTKIKFAGNLGPSVILDHAWPPLQISAHLVISPCAALSR